MDQAQKDNGGLVGRPSTVVPGRFGQELKVEQVLWSRKQGTANPSRPIFVLMHGWGSNEEDMADLMRYVAPYNDYASLRAPMVVPGSERGMFGPGYT